MEKLSRYSLIRLRPHLRPAPSDGFLLTGHMIKKDIFNLLEKNHIDSGIKIRDDASTKSGGSPYRAECASEKVKMSYRVWADEKKYGTRWAVEGVFSSVKRMFGETTRVSSVKGMIREVWMKFQFFQMIVHYGKGWA